MVRFKAAVFALALTTLGLPVRAADIELLDFWSPQCGPCMQMKPLMRAFEQANYPIREVDTSRDFETTRRFGVTQIPCFVMLVDDREVDRHVGPISSNALQQMFEKAKDIIVQRQRSRGQSPDPPKTTSATAGGATAAGPASRIDANPGPQHDRWPEPAANAVRSGETNQTNPLPATPIAAGSSDFPPNLIAATVRIRVEDSQGRSFGTGTIIDSRSGEALVVTCGHLFRESKGKGPMTVEMFEADAAGVRMTDSVPGQLISYDLDRDVAFVSIRPNRQVSVAPVAPARTRIERGDRVATVGCSNGNDPTLLPQRINMLDRYQGPPNIEVSGAPEEGRSGGGLFNLQGQLIGVCYAADYEGKEGLYAALESIHEELNRLRLEDVYNKKVDSRLASQSPTVIRGQVLDNPPLPPITPIESPASSPSGAQAPPIDHLSADEQAAYGEIMQRATESEVVVIVRPKAPGGQSEVITLDSASPEFVKALLARQRPTASATK
jgi:S1-C subfamily serine protease